MNRRKSLKDIALATGTMIALPSWGLSWSKQTLGVSNSCFSKEEEMILSALTDALIPAGEEEIGALSLGVDKFLNRLISDCYEAAIQHKIKLQLQAISQKANADYGMPFESCQKPQKMSIMEQFACSDADETRETFQLIKSETIRGFRTSKVVMTEYLDYQVMPGHFHGCVEVSS